VLMHQGGIEQIGTPEEVYDEPATPFVAGFIGAANVIRGYVHGGLLRFGGQAIEDADHIDDGSMAHAYIRPHDVRIGNDLNGGSVPATLERMSNLGWMHKLHLRLPDGQTLIAHVSNEDIGDLQLDDEVKLDLRNAKIFAPEEIAPVSDEIGPVVPEEAAG